MFCIAIPAQMTALRILWWKLRYGWRVWSRSSSDDVMFGHYWRMCFGFIATEGWRYHLECNDNSVALALAESPADAADEEMSEWTG